MNWFKKLFEKDALVIYESDEYTLEYSRKTGQYSTCIKDSFNGNCLELYRKSVEKLKELRKTLKHENTFSA